MKMMGSPNNGDIRAFSPNVVSCRYALLEKKTPISVRRCGEGGGGGAKGGTEKVRSFVTFFRMAFLKLIVGRGKAGFYYFSKGDDL